MLEAYLHVLRSWMTVIMRPPVDPVKLVQQDHQQRHRTKSLRDWQIIDRPAGSHNIPCSGHFINKLLTISNAPGTNPQAAGEFEGLSNHRGRVSRGRGRTAMQFSVVADIDERVLMPHSRDANTCAVLSAAAATLSERDSQGQV